ncbi:hypothetical protein RB620_07715 [Paenibacillus sp. LHD-117]|uniref:hypothetical protein n=1 Tax=Paenibacillus sp. LHD-117 TaxID=3071412 RepID=UPI0027DF5B8C|nr:hypothetical protein [Paenibacillus sp. LHD-117]MDQ6419328.1 hypothetical protein [Paenibacillus sp. LHD-117]
MYIYEWQKLVKNEPELFGEDIQDLMRLIERLLRSKVVYYDPTDVDGQYLFR